MITRIVIPQAFENMEEATVGAWLKNEGDDVSPGDALCELITEKTTFPLEAEGAGVLRKIGAAEKSIVPVGAVIGIIGDVNEELPDIESDNAKLRERLAASQNETAESAPRLSVPNVGTWSSTQSAIAPASGGSRVRATPAARRAARDRGLEIEEVAKAFPGKVLGEDDVKNFQ